MRIQLLENEGDTPLSVRVEGQRARALAPRDALYAIARRGELGVARREDEVLLRGAAVELIGHDPPAPPPAVEIWKPLQVTLFAALVAERQRVVLRDLGEALPAVLEPLWSAGQKLAHAVAHRVELDLKRLAELVDPDRVHSFDELRAFRVLDLAVRCSARRATPLELAAAAGQAPGEARWLAATVNAVCAVPDLEDDDLRAQGRRP